MTRPHHQHGFTLVELLTVIAIVGILAGIMVPAMGKVRASARKSACASNLRQMALASQLYSSENRGALIELPFAVPGVYWFRQIYPYLKGDAQNRVTAVFQCPDDTAAVDAFANNGTEWNGISYLLLKETTALKNVSQIENPARSPQFIDAETPDTADYRTAAKFRAAVEGTQSAWRHGSGVNVAYWDGHVTFVTEPTYEGVFNLNQN